MWDRIVKVASAKIGASRACNVFDTGPTSRTFEKAPKHWFFVCYRSRTAQRPSVFAVTGLTNGFGNNQIAVVNSVECKVNAMKHHGKKNYNKNRTNSTWHEPLGVSLSTNSMPKMGYTQSVLMRDPFIRESFAEVALLSVTGLVGTSPIAHH